MTSRCHERLSSTFDLLLIFLYFLTLTLTLTIHCWYPLSRACDSSAGRQSVGRNRWPWSTACKKVLLPSILLRSPHGTRVVWGGVSESDLMPSCIYTAAELAQSIYNMKENLVEGWQGDKKVWSNLTNWQLALEDMNWQCIRMPLTVHLCKPPVVTSSIKLHWYYWTPSSGTCGQSVHRFILPQQRYWSVCNVVGTQRPNREI